MGYADPETPTTFAPAALPLLLLGEPDQPLRQDLLILVLDSPCIHHHQRLKTTLRVFFSSTNRTIIRSNTEPAVGVVGSVSQAYLVQEL